MDDHCAAIEAALRHGAGGEVYNVGGQERENMDVVRRILDLTGASPDLVRHVAARPGHDRRYSVDSSKLRELSWQPGHSFEAGGLEETVDWYRENREWWEPIKSGDYKRYYAEQYAARLTVALAPLLRACAPPCATGRSPCDDPRSPRLVEQRTTSVHWPSARRERRL